MDNDNFSPFKIRGGQILGLVKLAVRAIETEGIVLQELEAEKGKNAIVWKSGGEILESIAGRLLGESHQLELHTNAPKELKAATLRLVSEKTFAAITAFVSGAVEQRTIIDSVGQSSFLQLGVNAKTRLWAPSEELPASALVVPGDLFIYEADVVNGIYWWLLYDGLTTRPWKKIGGPPLRAKATESLTVTENKLLTAGQAKITVPLSMVADVWFGSNAGNQGVGLNQLRQQLFEGIEPVKGETAIANLPENGNGPLSAIFEKLELAKNTNLNVQYKTESAKKGTFFQQHLSLDPIRVG